MTTVSSEPMSVELSSEPIPVERSSAPIPVERSSEPMSVERSSEPMSVEKSSEPVSLEKSGDPASVEKTPDAMVHSVARPIAGDLGGRTQDELEMIHYGKKPQLKRQFGFFAMVGLTCTLTATWESMLSVFISGFQNGGPAGLVYGYIGCFFGNLSVILSMAEMSSMIPLSGGQYHWVACLAPRSSMKYLSYVTGWMTMLGWQTAVASLAYFGGTIVQGLIVLNYPDYNFQRWHGTFLFYGVLLIMVAGNTLMVKLLPMFERLLLVLHLAGFLGIIIPLVNFAPHGSASDVFQTFINNGFQTDGLSFFVGIVTSVFAFLGADAAVHLAEEIPNASTVVPRSMVATLIINGLLGFAILIALLFCLGDPNAALNTPTGYPFIEVFYQATNSLQGATAMVAVVATILILGAIGILTTASRMLWAFARDNGVPFSNIIGRVDPSTKLPLYSILVTTVISLLLALINIGSSVAFNALVSLTVAGFVSSYGISIMLILIRRLQSEPIAWGPWRLGRFGVPINIVALIYVAITLFFSFWPTALDPTPATMNWSSLLFGAVIIFSTLFYVLFARKTFTGPIVEITESDVGSA